MEQPRYTSLPPVWLCDRLIRAPPVNPPLLCAPTLASSCCTYNHDETCSQHFCHWIRVLMTDREIKSSRLFSLMHTTRQTRYTLGTNCLNYPYAVTMPSSARQYLFLGSIARGVQGYNYPRSQRYPSAPNDWCGCDGLVYNLVERRPLSLFRKWA